METWEITLIGLMALAVAALIWAERAGSRAGLWIAKPTASTLFMILGLPAVDLALFAALILSFLGDFFLIPLDKKLFRVGIILFLLAHLAFIGAFLIHGIMWAYAALALVPLAIAAALIARAILPTVPRELKGAVIAYMIVITAMVALAAGTRDVWILGAAVAFWANDILVARDRFVIRDWRHRLVGLPLYYGAMAVFALLARGSL